MEPLASSVTSRHVATEATTSAFLELCRTLAFDSDTHPKPPDGEALLQACGLKIVQKAAEQHGRCHMLVHHALHGQCTRGT